MKWFTWQWYSYLFADLGNWREWKDSGLWPWTKIRCRILGHPNGEVYYNVNGLEPDHHCRDCDDLIG